MGDDKLLPAPWFRIREVRHIWRKQYIFRKNLTLRKLANLTRLTAAYIAGRADFGGVPFHIKVDVAPQCQLRCPVCLHGAMDRADEKSLPPPMEFGVFKQLVDQVAGRTHVMSLYNLGEPLVNRALPAMIAYAAKANINTYITSNFSFRMTDQRLTELACSGLTMLIVAVDGISNATYGAQRVRGRWDLIEANLRRFIEIRPKNGPRLVLQYIVFDHNRHEVPDVEAFARSAGIDDLLVFEGTTTPWLTEFAPRAGWQPREKAKLPRCAWPFFSALIGPEGNVYGCCHYRMDENYLAQDKTRPLGNVAAASLETIYASELYRTARRMANDPVATGRQDTHFCDGCPKLQSGAALPVRESIRR